MPSSDPTTARYCEVRSLTEAIAAPLSAEDQTAQSMPDVSPTKWHRAHTTWFFEEFVLGPNLAGYRPFHPGFRYLFNSYYEGVGPRHPRAERGAVTRPGIAEVAEYRRHVDEGMRRLLDAGVEPELAALIELGLHHEQQHQELALMDIKHVLSRNSLDPAYRQPRQDDPDGDPAAEPGPVRWHEHEGGLAEIGADGTGFAFDNEQPRHATYLAPFALASRPVTNAEVLAFIADGGYHRAELWLSDGWATVNAQRWEAPSYWRRAGDDGGHEGEDGDARSWTEFTLSGPRPVRPAEPVCHVSYYEADAIARWLGARLPTEAEWEAFGSVAEAREPLLDLDRVHPAAVTASDDGGGPAQLYGGVWEWTTSGYLPYPGFRAAPGAVGEYNGKFMVNQHVLRGGCCATPPGHIRATYRNFYPPNARWPFTGLRLARDLEDR